MIITTLDRTKQHFRMKNIEKDLKPALPEECTRMELQDRLLRIEAKLDRLTEQLGELGRIDERTDAAHARLNRHEVRLDWIEKEHREFSRASAEGKRHRADVGAAWVVGICGAGCRRRAVDQINFFGRGKTPINATPSPVQVEGST
jgi:hypothetical protein